MQIGIHKNKTELKRIIFTASQVKNKNVRHLCTDPSMKIVSFIGGGLLELQQFIEVHHATFQGVKEILILGMGANDLAYKSQLHV